MNIVYIRLSFCVKWIVTFKKNKRENLSTSFWSVIIAHYIDNKNLKKGEKNKTSNIVFISFIEKLEGFEPLTWFKN